MAKKKSSGSVYVVLRGSYEEAPEDIIIVGVYSTEEAAFKVRDAEYKSTINIEDEDDEAEVNYDLTSHFIDNGHEFWNIEEKPLN